MSPQGPWLKVSSEGQNDRQTEISSQEQLSMKNTGKEKYSCIHL